MKISSEKKYAQELRVFALTLHFYSSTAYNYVRKTFAKSLPHPKTLQKWYQAVDGSPGYTQESLRALKLKAKECKDTGKPLVCSLIMDEMAIKKHVEWNGKKQVGYINYGVDMDSDALPEATEAIVFLVVAVNCRWKLPVAYFLITRLNASEKANLVKGCLSILHNAGVIVTSVTFDGAAANLAMAGVLGANFSPNNLKTFFLHPDTKDKVFLILDICHMVKLIRNTLGDWGLLRHNNNNIKWEFIKSLIEYQEEMGLHAATKIRRRHLNYKKEIMKVKLATQVFSNSVADALDYFSIDLKLDKFQEAQYTAEFCRIFNDIFDIMNVRNSFSKLRSKRALSLNNIETVKEIFRKTRTYIRSIKDIENNDILISKRKTGFLGILVNMCSIEGILDLHVKTQQNINYLLTYKLCQDHLEMFFSIIRCRGGFTNNPTSIQFESAYKKILVHTELSSAETANCLAQDDTSILKFSSSKLSRQADELYSEEYHHDFSDDVIPENCSTYICNVVEYIAGFVARRLVRSIGCKICAESLITSTDLYSALLLDRKNRGGLIKPHPSVTTICKVAEVIFRTSTNFCRGNVIEKMVIASMRKLNYSSLFPQLSDHMLDQNPLNNHFLQLVRSILKTYFTIRLHHRNKSLMDAKIRIRHTYTKLIHFKNQ